MPVIPVTETLAVGPQLTVDDMADLAAAGYTTVVNNRPDGEQPDQPESDDLRAAADRHGLTFLHQPVVDGEITQAQVDAFARTLAHSDGPVAAFCRSGKRSVTLWALANSQTADIDALVATASAAGFDLTDLLDKTVHLRGR
ncbi:TIGR01244 family sulfur transferase [Rhodovibrio salinarum]|uniref:TIGR01244 family phosphatase n=1 Tax=Rhodovibrio salinarum TaxID=1087 RepID=A0A934QK04_9PROT|nr:TIGR01244 family sulfur transferase [Rhodovibrio salinarum]MBK1698266.1 TIGR01244 family phosphatase [Rhodovibrio salinarum]